MRAQKREHCVLKHIYSPSGLRSTAYAHAEVMCLDSLLQVEEPHASAKIDLKTAGVKFPWINALITAGPTGIFLLQQWIEEEKNHRTERHNNIQTDTSTQSP